MATTLTRDDLDALPDDGLRHELIDGAFVMTRAPGRAHQRIVGALFVALRSASEGTSLEAVLAPFDVALGSSVVQPDIIVAPRESGDARDLRTPPMLVVEVRSASTGWLDEGRKRTLYEEHGVAAYWLVDPIEPSIVALELQDGRFVEVATAHGDHSVQLTSPFPITVNPAVLARG
jgi:Uma2 family endonuclease